MLKSKSSRLATVLWLAGMSGVVALSVTVIPQLLASAPVTVPVEAALLASMAQSGILLGLAVWCGVALSKRVGLAAPVVERMVGGGNGDGDMRSVVQRQLLPALVVGVLVGLYLTVLPALMPVDLSDVAGSFEIPVIVRVLYGGITEELLMRWGVMTLLVWLPWRFLQKRNGPPMRVYVILAIFASALLFGLGHLPTVTALGGSLTASVMLYVVIGNTLPGLLFGFLYWRFGLEASILAHGIAHCVLAVATG